MALKSTIYKAQLQIADMDRHLYADHALTLARHPSETDERMMIRLLAFAMSVPADDLQGALTFAGGLSDTEEPDLWQKDLTGQLVQWIEVGQPLDERRLTKACGRAEVVRLWAYSSAVPVWWSSMEGKLSRLSNLEVWQVPAETSKALAALAQRSMQLQVTVQDGAIWVGDGKESVQVEPIALRSLSRRRG
ncbi:MAG: YaeQ family protein [Ideonella sp.]|nr:YaeQ family protein [Ideonella sp.]